MMAENSLGTAEVTGTGRDGRITKGDVIAAVEAGVRAGAGRPSASARDSRPVSSPSLPQVRAPLDTSKLLEGRPEQRVAMSRLRQRVAERLLQSQATNAILTTFNEVNMQPVMDLRKKYLDRFEKEHGARLGFMSFFVKAAVHALKKYPVVNASIDGNDIVYHGYFDIGVAVGSPRGLVVPVVRNADQMSFAQIEKQIADYGKRAATASSVSRISPAAHSRSPTAACSARCCRRRSSIRRSRRSWACTPPRTAPVVENGQVVVRPINYLALSYDHRIIDGREAVLFLVAIKEALEDPARLLLDL
jgi:2-oxoglutarate dehydrogenase E2 component (dihydrolipoamide succinyltransferase)